MEKVTLTFVGRYDTKKDGTPLLTKAGKPYTSLRIKCNEHGDKYLSGFDGSQTKDWKIGDTVDIEVEEKGEYLNFSVPKAGSVDFTRLATLENKVTTLTLSHNKLVSILVGKGIIPAPVDTIPGTSVEYPKETAKEVDWNPKDAESVGFNGVDPEMESLMQSAEGAMS